MRCTNEGNEIHEFPAKQGGIRKNTLVCADHLKAMESGEIEWVWRVGDVSVESREPNMVLMGDDLLGLNEWVVEDSDGYHSDLSEASTPEGEVWTLTLTARQRGKDMPEKLQLVFKRGDLQRFLGLT